MEKDKVSGLKKRAIKKKTDKLKSEKKVVIRPLEAYKKILLISIEEKQGFRKDIEGVFPMSKTHHLHFRPIKEDRSVGFDYSVHPSDFNLTGVLKNDKLSNLTKDHFDLVLDLSTDSVTLDYFTKSVSADLVIGRMSAQKEAHDLRVEYGTDDRSFLNNVKHQLLLLSENGTE
mgnify:CR=1 FL=1